jgi:predicted NAD-dependent protein-ADP-ribosyltransferase YbiA (DUF1768 family)
MAPFATKEYVDKFAKAAAAAATVASPPAAAAVVSQSTGRVRPRPAQSQRQWDIRPVWIGDKENMDDPRYGQILTMPNGSCFFEAVEYALSESITPTDRQRLREMAVDRAEVLNPELEVLFNEELSVHEEIAAKLALQGQALEKFTAAHQEDIAMSDAEWRQRHGNMPNKNQIEYAKMLDVYVALSLDAGHAPKFKNYQQQREFKRTNEYYAEESDIFALETLLGVKFIIFSTTRANNASLCQRLKNKVINKCCILNNTGFNIKAVGDGNQTRYVPKFYILLNHDLAHYTLVTYDGRLLSTFEQLPDVLKQCIVAQFMADGSGSAFNFIPDFINLKSRLVRQRGGRKRRRSGSGSSSAHVGKREIIDHDDADCEAKSRRLYDPDVVLCFHADSPAKPKPGQGHGESAPHNADVIVRFAGLAAIPNWRRKLSNFWPQPFTLDGHRWATVEHYYQASKFRRKNPEFYVRFALDHGGKLAERPELAKAAGSVSGRQGRVRLRPASVRVDSDFFRVSEDFSSGGGHGGSEQRANRVLHDALLAKFAQNPDLRDTLLATSNAKLLHYRSGGRPPEICDKLMLVREELK